MIDRQRETGVASHLEFLSIPVVALAGPSRELTIPHAESGQVALHNNWPTMPEVTNARSSAVRDEGGTACGCLSESRRRFGLRLVCFQIPFCERSDFVV